MLEQLIFTLHTLKVYLASSINQNKNYIFMIKKDGSCCD